MYDGHGFIQTHVLHHAGIFLHPLHLKCHVYVIWKAILQCLGAIFCYPSVQRHFHIRIAVRSVYFHYFVPSAQHMVNQGKDQPRRNVQHKGNIVFSFVLYIGIHQCHAVIFIQRIYILIISALLNLQDRDIGHDAENTVNLGCQDSGIILKYTGKNFHFLFCEFSWAVKVISAVLCFFRLRLLLDCLPGRLRFAAVLHGL